MFNSIVVELLHKIVELLQFFRFPSKSFFFKLKGGIFVIQLFNNINITND